MRAFLTKSSLDFFCSLLIFCLLYRLGFLLASAETALDATSYRITILSFGLANDFAVCFILAALFTLCYAGLLWLTQRLGFKPKFLGLGYNILLTVSFFIIVILFIIHLKIFTSIFIGLNYIILQSYLNQGASISTLTEFLNSFDLALLAVATACYIGLKFVSWQRLQLLLFYVLIPIYFVFSLYGSVTFLELHLGRVGQRVMAMYANPLNQITVSYFKSFNEFNRQKIPLGEQQRTIAFKDTDFLAAHPQSACFASEPCAKQPWNIVIFVLESVSSEYVGKMLNQNAAMPFLNQLKHQSVWFTNNYTGGNISALGQFSLLTGLYPNPTPSHFEMRNDLRIPTIVDWLPSHYDSFLVSASNNLYFSMGLNRSFKEYDNAQTIQPNSKHLFFNMFLDETIAHDFFKQRLVAAKHPFLALFWSGATHYPYPDYSERFRVSDQTQDPYVRYLNSMRLLDHEIESTVAVLREQKLLEHTIVIVVGDHGELFGQHGGMRVHGRSLYEEEIKVPLLIYAPTLFKPQVVTQVTSSTDVVPTLLSALGIVTENKVQGESLLANFIKREYVFSYGDEDEIAAIDQQQHKMIISFANATCQSFNLHNDPTERHPLSCTAEKQKRAILKFRNFQPYILSHYNNASLSRS